ncbi:MAG TPA: TrmH family RNA methyltransferase [Myxococcota bacterium]|nr:TrmH family RNA methyltransferase [Myxococcota bacterium]
MAEGSRVRQIAGVAAILAALRAREDVRLLLVAEDARAEDVRALVARAEETGVAVRTATRNVLARLSVPRPAEDALALAGRDPEAPLAEALARGGAFWLLVGVAYPGNVGMVIRTAEVSGADGIAIDGRFDHEAKRAALRASMRADKFMPVSWEDAGRVLDCAREAGHRAVALDETGPRAHWEADLTGPRVFVVGGENGGIPAELLARCDERVRVPMAGFIPCYNLQAAVSAVAVERLRQLAAGRR